MKSAKKGLFWAENRILGAIYVYSRRIYCLKSYQNNSKFTLLTGIRRSQRIHHHQLRGHVCFVQFSVAFTLGIEDGLRLGHVQPAAILAKQGFAACARQHCVCLLNALQNPD